MEKNYICKIASVEEMIINWDYQINKANNKENWKKEKVCKIKNRE